MLYDHISGNATYNPYYTDPIEEVEVNTILKDGVMQPAEIIMRGKTYTVTAMIGCRYDKIHRATEYGIKIGQHRTKVWCDSCGRWFVVPHKPRA